MVLPTAQGPGTTGQDLRIPVTVFALGGGIQGRGKVKLEVEGPARITGEREDNPV